MRFVIILVVIVVMDVVTRRRVTQSGNVSIQLMQNFLMGQCLPKNTHIYSDDDKIAAILNRDEKRGENGEGS